MPAYLSDLFGTTEIGAIHGYSLTAWGLAGIAGPTLASVILESTGAYTTALYVINVVLVLGLLTVGALRWRINSIEAAQVATTAPAGD